MKFNQYLTENEYKPDVFYNVEHIRDKSKFLKDCISKAFRVKVDELDCKISFRRMPTKKSADDIIKMAKENEKAGHCFHVFIIRNYVFGKEPYIEAGVSTNKPLEKEYFIFIYIKLDKLDYFVKKYKLSRRN